VQLAARNVGELVKSTTVQSRAANAVGLAKLSGDITYRVPENSGLVLIIVDDTSPELAAREANALANAFITLNAEELRTASSAAQAAIEAQLKRLRQQIASTETSIAAVRASSGSGTSVSDLQDRLDSLNTAYQGVLQDAQVLPSAETLLATSVLINDPAVPNSEPVGPQPLLNLALSLAGGLLLGAAIARGTEPRKAAPETGR
jgi:uncharacterized protein involved in exopolysaccharide biosynthesis